MFAPRRCFELRPLALVAALIPLAFAWGCEQAVPGGKSIAERSATPEGQLENVMKRLEYALGLARPAEGAGVVSRREATHRLLPPAENQKSYDAEVTIATSTGLAPEKVEEIKSESQEKSSPADAQGTIEAKANVDIPELPKDPAETIAAAAEVSEKKVYKLRFQNDRWELVDPPADKLSGADGECLRYALSDG